MTQLTDKVFAYDIPPGSYGEGLVIEVDGKYYLNLIDEDGVMLAGTKPLPPGSWHFLFTTKAATEEDARKVVVPLNSPFLKGDKRYKDFTMPQSHTVADAVCTALESLASLLRSKGLDTDSNFALIEKM